MEPDLEKVKKQAENEIEDEDFLEAVKEHKVKLRTKKSLFDFIPFKISITRR